jgi:hypothetical protein
MLQSKAINTIELADKNKPQGVAFKITLSSLPQGDIFAINTFCM